jgi:hypothetical protein
MIIKNLKEKKRSIHSDEEEEKSERDVDPHSVHY